MRITKIQDTTWGRFDGYVITLEDDSLVQMGIRNHQNCCEDWGYLISEDDLSEFIGAEFLSVEVTDTKLAHVEMRNIYEGSCMFVNINTSKGLLQFVAYNEHNGYYGHEAVVVVNGTTQHSETL